MLSGLPSITLPNLSLVHLSCWQWNCAMMKGSSSICRTSTISTSPTNKMVGSSYTSCCLKCLKMPSNRSSRSLPQCSFRVSRSCFRNALVTAGASTLIDCTNLIMSKPGWRVRISRMALLLSLPANSFSFTSSTLCTTGWSLVSYFSFRSSTSCWPFWYALVPRTSTLNTLPRKGMDATFCLTLSHVVCSCCTNMISAGPL
mmetsp:Transcript_38739/g.86152  ORF Transcript_38739/g.86152 Transcript_38739/m.86152 type:complete len:201 (-) Transcript_38739:598-1200(-)